MLHTANSFCDHTMNIKCTCKKSAHIQCLNIISLVFIGTNSKQIIADCPNICFDEWPLRSVLSINILFRCGELVWKCLREVHQFPTNGFCREVPSEMSGVCYACVMQWHSIYIFRCRVYTTKWLAFKWFVPSTYSVLLWECCGFCGFHSFGLLISCWNETDFPCIFLTYVPYIKYMVLCWSAGHITHRCLLVLQSYHEKVF